MGEVGSVWGAGEVELFGGEASPAPPSLDETLGGGSWELSAKVQRVGVHGN